MSKWDAMYQFIFSVYHFLGSETQLRSRRSMPIVLACASGSPTDIGQWTLSIAVQRERAEAPLEQLYREAGLCPGPQRLRWLRGGWGLVVEEAVWVVARPP